MKRSFLALFLLVLVGGVLSQKTDVVEMQNRLKAEGFYTGIPSGTLDTETVGALKRYQIHHGLRVSGKLDAQTTRALTASAPPVKPPVLAGHWQRLANGQMQFVPASGTLTPATAVTSLPPAAPAPPTEGLPAPSPVLASPAPTRPAPTKSAPAQSSPADGADQNADHFRGYVEAFVEAGLSRPLGSEIKFFAERVNYYGTVQVPRREIQRDLLRYDRKWPHRQFWIDGEIQIQPQPGGIETKVVFPLRYELRNGAKHASGKVVKTLTLVPTAEGDLQITAVSEWSPGNSTGSSNY